MGPPTRRSPASDAEPGPDKIPSPKATNTDGSGELPEVNDALIADLELAVEYARTALEQLDRGDDPWAAVCWFVGFSDLIFERYMAERHPDMIAVAG